MLSSTASQRRGVWEPLSLIVYGYAVHPLSPSQRDTRVSGRTRLSTVTEGSDFAHRDVVSLEVGDEIYAFEKYTPKGKESDGVWYRGYVVCTTRRPHVNWTSSADPSSSKASKAEEPQQVFIGIFPASHIHVRDELSDAEGRLADVASQVNGNKDPYLPWNKEKGREMETLKEEEEDPEQGPGRKSFRLGPPPDQANSSRAGLPVYPPSVRSQSPSESQPFKPLPPRPSLKSGDDTASGQVQPIIDEIASALREWHNLMFLYLARRDYKLFYTVRDHIEALHLGRRQLLAQTLSAEETVSLRRDCVGRLVSGNVVQGLDVIVRHPTWGGLVTVDVEGEIDPRSWVSAVRMYAMQVALAYMDVSPDSTVASKAPGLGAAAEYTSVGPAPTPANSVFPESGRPRANTRLLGSLAPPQPAKPASCEVLPCETAELYFSLYNKSDMRFVSEEFCAVLNHNGVLARDPSARIRTIFTDLVQADVQESIYLVCKIIRNGALKITNNFNSGVPVDNPRRGSEGSYREASTSSRWDTPTPLNGNVSSTNVVRSGSVSEGTPSGQFRRPFGCAVLELSQLREFAKDHAEGASTREHTMPIHIPTNEAVYSMLHQDIIANNIKEFEKSPRAEMMAVSVKIFYGDAKTIVRENPSLLINAPVTARLGFPDVVFPGDIRNEMYIKLWSGEFFSSHGSSRLSVSNFAPNNNVQVTAELRDHLGNTIERGISQGSGEPPVTQFHSMVFQRNNVPTFGELMNARERTTVRVGGELERPFAFAYLPLLPDSRAFLEDGSHSLVLYRITSPNQVPPDTYLSRLPWTTGGQRVESLSIDQDLIRSSPPIRDNLIIRTSLCSTKFTQNQVLLSLLNWDQLHDRDVLSTILSKFTFVGEVEIVKFLRDIFDSLFAILVSQSNVAGEMDGLVFNALVTVLGIVQDRRFSNFQPVLDVYIEKHFNCSSASSHMIQSMNRLLATPSAAETAMALRAALKVWHYLFKFIVRSRELQKAKEVGIAGGATSEHLEATFKRELQMHLSEVNRMMAATSPASIIGTQTIALQHFTSILPELAKIFANVELVSIVTSFANSVTAAKGKVVIWKLIMYLQVVKGFLFDIPQSRSLLVEAVVVWIKPHFGRFDEYTQTQPGDSENARDNARAVTIIAQNLVNPVTASDRNLLRQEQDNVEYLLSLMPRLLDSYREFQNQDSLKALERTRSGQALASPVPSIQVSVFNCTLAEIAIVFLVLVLSSPRKDIINFLEASLEIEGKDNFSNLISQFFKVACSILGNEAFPCTWLNVNILAHKVLIKMADPDEEYQFNSNLWREALYMLLKLLSSDQLVIEEFSPQKRRAVWRLAGDIRGEGATILLRLWDALGWPEQGYQVAMNTLVGHVVNLCLSHHDQLRNNAVQILYSMIVSEYHISRNFEDIENELVNKLDTLFMSDSKGDDISRTFFIGQLRHLFDSSYVDEQLRQRVSNFLDSVDLFLELLLNVRALPEGEEFADDRVIATLRLMNFIRRIGRDEIYIKYVHQLVNMHLQSQNYVEAALTLKLHADLHDWDLVSFVEPMEDLGLPRQSQFHRKETLCLLILDYLGKGKAWENAIDICNELAYQHSEITYNYSRLAEILRHKAALLEHIVTDQRYYPDYFRVAFYGTFPVAIRNKQFIYRGYEWEKFGAFCERMLNKHPGSQLLRTMGDPPVDIRFGTDQYIQCTAVSPEPDKSLPIFNNPDVPSAVRAYYEHSAINIFSCQRPVTKIGPNGDEEIWLIKGYFTTEETFPTVLRRSEVVDIHTVEISPMESALNDIEQKNKELNTLKVKYSTLAKTGQPVSTNALSMTLNNAVDAPVSGGIFLYREAFLSPEYLVQNPDRADMVQKLRDAIDEQVRVIDTCLKIHGSLRFFRRTSQTRSAVSPWTLHLLALPSPQSTRFPYQGEGSLMHLHERNRSQASNVTGTTVPAMKNTFYLPPLQLGRPVVSPQPTSPRSMRTPTATDAASIAATPAPPAHSKQTPLQRNLAHLARHGFPGVSSAPGLSAGAAGPPGVGLGMGLGDVGGSGSLSAGSPQGSFVNVGSTLHGATSLASGAASMMTSNIGSSIGSIKGRFSRFGSLNFGRHGRDG
ncbi:cytoplasmic protein [Phellopilus nigrolimitatus]|nr:cytoplasmic protein [Phellopilus nigrolimitatus]